MKETVSNIIKSIIKGWKKRIVLISYATLIAAIANGWYLDIIGYLKNDDMFETTIRAEYGDIGIYEVLTCLIITAFYIAYLCYNYKRYASGSKSNTITINNKNKNQTGNNINNGVQVINNFNDISNKQNSSLQTDLFQSVYILYFNEIFSLINVKDYSNWCYGLAITGETIISRNQLNNLERASKYCQSRVPHKNYELYDSLIKDLGYLLKDLSELIGMHTKESSDGILRTVKFYHIREYDRKRYDYLHDIYIKYVLLIGDLTFELTRMLNLILEKVRIEDPTFLIDEGILRIYSIDEDIIYRTEEKSNAPYPGINEFIKANEHRTLHYSSSFDYDVEIFWNV